MSSFLRVAPDFFTVFPFHPSLDNAQSHHPPHGFQGFILTDADSSLNLISTIFYKRRRPHRPPPSQSIFLPASSRASIKRSSGSAIRSELKENHTKNGMEYTSSVTRVERLLHWPQEREIEGGWQGVDMSVNLITHTFNPKALVSTQSFIVLVICACFPIFRCTGFITIQNSLTHESGDLVPNLLCERDTASAPQNTVFASYASVGKAIATTSNAGGANPQWIQRSWTLGGVPKAIVADVGLFIGWTAQRRSQCNQSRFY
ncbi:hypothetical protein BDV40DRAFT_290007 [Aspergillus tamarii]|uniref:DUF3074 domain-containing protein n=1 Tax=Aspergillus tamarii TaxID=41984 RepID=A0A5N6UPJ8_ASPTM|nr:hypothetical protein BDV40DRAFT_290007 [Aspergillus tamarii]